jgi:hypothetical protein
MIIRIGNEKLRFDTDKEPVLFIMSEDERLRLIYNLTAMKPKNKTRKYMIVPGNMENDDKKEYLNLE